MLDFYARTFVGAVSGLQFWESVLASAWKPSGDVSPQSQAVATDALYTYIGGTLTVLCDQLSSLPDPLPGVAREVADLQERLARYKHANLDFQTDSIREALGGIRRSIERGLEAHLFFCVPASDRQLMGASAPSAFGASVQEKISDATADVAAAARCIAKGEPTASVFHSMRAAEHGLRLLARRLRVTVRDHRKPCPISEADWNKVITACKHKIEKARQAARSEARKQRLARLSDLADRCDYMREIWRNDISHAGKPYSDLAAREVFERTKAFMQGVADAV